MKKKAVISLLLAASMLTACGETETTEEKETKTSTSIESTLEEEESSETSIDSTSEEETESSKEDTTTTEESTAPTAATYSGEEYKRFLDDLQATLDEGKSSRYYGPDYSEDDVMTSQAISSMQIRSSAKGFHYTYTDVDQDGVHELLIGFETTDPEQNQIIYVDAFVVIDAAGKYKIIAASWDRISMHYLGNGYFVCYASSGAACHLSTLYHYNAQTTSMDVVAQMVKDSETPDPNGLPVFYYSLYEGCEWPMQGLAKDDPNAMHGDEAKAKWDEMVAKVSDNELLGTNWDLHGTILTPTPAPTPKPSAETSSGSNHDNDAEFATLQYDDVKACAREWMNKGMIIDSLDSKESKNVWGFDGEILECVAAAYENEGLLQMDWAIKFADMDTAREFFHELEESFFGEKADIKENGDGSFSYTVGDIIKGSLSSDGLLILIMP